MVQKQSIFTGCTYCIPTFCSLKGLRCNDVNLAHPVVVEHRSSDLLSLTSILTHPPLFLVYFL